MPLKLKRKFFAIMLMIISSRQDSGLQLKLGGTYEETEISPSDLTELPPFLRFRFVGLYFGHSFNENDAQPIADKCLLFENLLQSVKPALARSALFFSGDISESKSFCFRDHLELLNYLRDRLLPICNTSRAYEFFIKFDSDSDQSAAKHVIASILQTSQLVRCSSAQFNIFYGSDGLQLRLPVNEISDWLHMACDRERKKSLHVNCEGFEIENSQEMINHLQEVFYIVKF